MRAAAGWCSAGAALAAWGLACYGAPSDPAAVLRQAAARIVAGIDQAPNYTCSESMVRQIFQPVVRTRPRACRVVLQERQHSAMKDDLQLFSIDRLRLDVIWTKLGETYSWAGARRFEDNGVEAVASGGPMSSGFFAGILKATFESDVKSFRYVGEEIRDGKDVMEYQFQVPESDSHYRVKTKTTWLTTAYQGRLLIDPATANVVHLEIDTAELPQTTGACQSTYALDFAAVQIGSTPLLLPAVAHQWFVYPDMSEAATVAEFGSCHEYLGESTIRFDLPADVAAAPASSAPDSAPAVESGLAFTTELVDAIDTDRAAAGDPFRARLVNDLRNRRRQIVARAGSIVEGRLHLVEKLVRTNQVRVVLAPTALLTESARMPLAATLARQAELPRGIAILLQPREPTGIFHFAGTHVVIPQGFRSDWRSITPATK